MKVSDIFKKPFKTPFDEIDLSLPLGVTGGYIRDRLIDLGNEYGRISEMASISAYRMETAESRMELAENIAMAEIADKHAGDRAYTAARKTAMARQWEVLIPGDKEKTTPYKEEIKYFAYKYIAQRGKDRVRELNNILDLGRSILSWDKQEVDRMER
jgi:hypothetical protein